MSEIRAALISDLAGTGPAELKKQVAAKTMVNSSQAGVMGASLNVSTVTDVGTGKNHVNSTNAFTSVSDVAPVHTSDRSQGEIDNVLMTASVLPSWHRSSTGSLGDATDYFSLCAFGDLA